MPSTPPAPVRGVPAPPAPAPARRGPRTTLAALALCALLALATWAVIGWNVLPRPYGADQRTRPACGAATAGAACAEPVQSAP